MEWFTSDTHFDHANIINHAHRSFKNTDEMNTALIDNINNLVMPDDILFHHGDFAWRGLKEIRERIKCKNIVLILGNHDKPKAHERNLFRSIHVRLETKLWINGKEQGFVMDHYAMRIWNKAQYGVWHTYGHSHGSLEDNPNALSWDVGVDNVFKVFGRYSPVNGAQLAEIMAAKTWKPVDHHGQRKFETDAVS